MILTVTEPQAGSPLPNITNLAEPTDQDYHKIRRQKIFISARDYDYVEKVIHLILAKVKGAPAGVKGNSLSVVPKNRIEENGQPFIIRATKSRSSSCG